MNNWKICWPNQSQLWGACSARCFAAMKNFEGKIILGNKAENNEMQVLIKGHEIPFSELYLDYVILVPVPKKNTLKISIPCLHSPISRHPRLPSPPALALDGADSAALPLSALPFPHSWPRLAVAMEGDRSLLGRQNCSCCLVDAFLN